MSSSSLHKKEFILENILTPESVKREYDKGRAYNESIGLYDTVRQNEDFVAGRQWEGVNAPDLDKPVMNFLKRVVNFCVSMLVSDDINVSVSPPEGSGFDEEYCSFLVSEIDKAIERGSLKSLSRDLLRSAAVDGDAALYFYTETALFENSGLSGSIPAGFGAKISCKILENTEVIFGNPCEPDIQKQPYLIISERVYKDEPGGGTEPVHYGEPPDAGNTAVALTRFWREDGTVRFMKIKDGQILKPPTDTRYRRYPIAWLSWEKTKKSYHGQSMVTELIPNQIAVNKLFAMALRHQQLMAFPKIFYDRTKIRSWSNRVGEAIGVAGNPSEAVAVAFRAPDMSAQLLELIDRTVRYSRDFMGANDAVLGNIKPDNASAILAVQRSSTAPLELQKLSFYQFIEDCVRIMADIMRADYATREFYDRENQRVTVDFRLFDLDSLDLRVDVGASSYWSEIGQLETMDNLFSKGIITDAATYIQGIPAQYLRNKNKILEGLKE